MTPAEKHASACKAALDTAQWFSIHGGKDDAIGAITEQGTLKLAPNTLPLLPSEALSFGIWIVHMFSDEPPSFIALHHIAESNTDNEIPF